MTPDIVVDIGNSRIKWGICRDLGIHEPPRESDLALRWKLGLIHDESEIGLCSLTLEQSEWENLRRELPNHRPLKWAIASVNPDTSRQFIHWLDGHGDSYTVIDQSMRLPLSINVESPERIGIDRIMNAIGALPSLLRGSPAIIVDAGTAITVDLIDEKHIFQGGAILPGMRLMFQSLHDYTAKLPLINEWDLDRPSDEYDYRLPGKNTENALVCGVIAAASGGVDLLVQSLGEQCQSAPNLIITGGMGRTIQFHSRSRRSWIYKEKLTLEGIRIAAEALP